MSGILGRYMTENKTKKDNSKYFILILIGVFSIFKFMNMKERNKDRKIIKDRIEFSKKIDEKYCCDFKSMRFCSYWVL